MDNYKPNSFKSKEMNNEKPADKKIEKVVTGKVSTKKRNKILDIFLSEDASSIKDYIFLDVIVPAIKNAIYDTIVGSLDMSLFDGRKGKGSGSTKGSHVSYNRFYEKNDRGSGRSEQTKSAYSYNDIIVETRPEAEEVISQLESLIDTYGQASVADLNDLVGITGVYTDNKYGWKNVRNAEAVRVHNGYMIRMPKAIPID